MGSKYLGAGTLVGQDFTDIGVKLDYSTDNFAAWDRFGRILDQYWSSYGSTWSDWAESNGGSDDPEHFTYTYDRAGNATGKANAQDAALNELYSYDDLNRLTETTRGGIVYQSWGLDGQGNMVTV